MKIWIILFFLIPCRTFKYWIILCRKIMKNMNWTSRWVRFFWGGAKTVVYQGFMISTHKFKFYMRFYMRSTSTDRKFFDSIKTKNYLSLSCFCFVIKCSVCIGSKQMYSSKFIQPINHIVIAEFMQISS